MNSITSLCQNKYTHQLLAASLAVWMPLAVNADPQQLSEPDRIAVEEKLEKIQKQSEDRVGGLYARAVQDYRAAIQSDAATMEMYLKCVEKVEFIDQKKKASEFREWKRRNKDRLSSGSFRKALRHQLSWLLLSIEAAKRDGDLSEMGTRAIGHLNQIFQNAEELKPHRGVLRRNVLSSVFAQGYNLNIKVKDWPKSALDIGNIYDKVVLPPLRNVERVGELRANWVNRIKYEELVFKEWHEEETSRIGLKDALTSPEYEKFLSEARPTLLWEMEIECFEAGDEQAAALKMLSHLETYISHKSAPDWIKEMKEIIMPEGAEEDSADSVDAKDTAGS